MMQLPNLPHDNLYKFVAFSGLAIVILINYLYYSMGSDVVKSYPPAIADQQALNDRWERNNDKYDQLNKKLKAALDAGGTSRERLDELLAESDEIRAESARINAENFRTRAQLDVIHSKSDDFKLIAEIYGLGSLVGWTLIILGCLFWYVRVQRPQDQLVALQARELQNKLGQSKRSPRRAR